MANIASPEFANAMEGSRPSGCAIAGEAPSHRDRRGRKTSSLRDPALSERGAGGGEASPTPAECRRIIITPPLDALWILSGAEDSLRAQRSWPARYGSVLRRRPRQQDLF